MVASLQLSGRAYSYSVLRSEHNPEDEMQVTLNLAFDGVVRCISVSQNMYSHS
ncbi:hypothetical protein QEO94_07545 [Kingella negevensis]|uniref:hypothetical protein n=1 Tax=Kingella negevensis TaxID=1522312 RepID=UPI002543F172|nr:hypothetical protein [Kingella negevensis]WII92496.1 hypothetical protein QEO94_07545 [Kingella negevensis]